MKPLTVKQIIQFSAANMGANLVYQFANHAFPLFLGAYSISNVLVGFLAQERSFIGAFVQPVVGTISDRLRPNRLGRRRPFFLIGAPLTALSLVFLAAHPPLWSVIAVMTVLSFFLAVAYDPYLALLNDIVPQGQRGLVGSVMTLFNMVAGFAVVGLSFLLWEDHQGMVFWIVAAGLVASFAITFFTIAEPPMAPVVKRKIPRVAVGTYLRELASRRELMKYLAVAFFFWFGNGGITPFLTRFGVDVLGLEENVSFLLVLPAGLGAVIFALPAGLAARRYGKKPVLVLGMLLFGLVALIGAQVAQGVPDGAAIMFLSGVANAATTSLLVPLLADFIPTERAGEFMGIGALVQSLSQPIGAMSAGAMADAMGSMRGAFAAGGIAMLIGFAILLTVNPETAQAFDRSPVRPIDAS